VPPLRGRAPWTAPKPAPRSPQPPGRWPPSPCLPPHLLGAAHTAVTPHSLAALDLARIAQSLHPPREQAIPCTRVSSMPAGAPVCHVGALCSMLPGTSWGGCARMLQPLRLVVKHLQHIPPHSQAATCRGALEGSRAP
jgi:hypothetical protein